MSLMAKCARKSFKTFFLMKNLRVEKYLQHFVCAAKQNAGHHQATFSYKQNINEVSMYSILAYKFFVYYI